MLKVLVPMKEQYGYRSYAVVRINEDSADQIAGAQIPLEFDGKTWDAETICNEWKSHASLLGMPVFEGCIPYSACPEDSKPLLIPWTSFSDNVSEENN